MTAVCFQCNSPVCHGARFCPNCGSPLSATCVEKGHITPAEHEQRIAPLIKKLGDKASQIYTEINPNPKRGLSAIRYSLLKEGTTVAEQVRRVYWHYAANNLVMAVHEAAKVGPDIKWDLERNFYKLMDDFNS